MKFKSVKAIQTFERFPKAAAGFSVVWLLVIGGMAFFWHLGSTGLVDETEPLFAEAARLMVETGDWITPYYNGETRFDKPPLVYWLMAVGYQLIGVNEWAVRLPSAISAIALAGFCLYALYRFGMSASAGKAPDQRLRQRWIAAWIGSAAMSLNLLMIIWARTGVSDLLLCACMGSALLCFFLGYATTEQVEKTATFKLANLFIFPKGWYLTCYGLTALAVLTKGPVGAVLPGLAIASFLLYLGKFRIVLQEMGIAVGGAIFVGLTAPWYILVTLANGSDYIESFFGYHNFERFTRVVNGHSAPWYFYFLVVLVGFAPLSVYLPCAIARLQVWRRSFWSRQPRTNHLGLFAFFWFASVFLFFTIATTKLPSYVIPLVPAAAILVALFWSEKLTCPQPDRNHWGILISGILNVLLLLAFAGVSFLSPQLLGYDAAAPNLPERLDQSSIPLAGGIIWLVTGGTVAILLLRRQNWRWLWGANLLGFVLFLIFVITPAYFLVDETRQRPLRELAIVEQQVKQPLEMLLMVGDEKPSVVFYAQHSVVFVEQTQQAIALLEAIAQTHDEPMSVLMLSHPRKLEEILQVIDNTEILDTKGAYQLIRVPVLPGWRYRENQD